MWWWVGDGGCVDFGTWESKAVERKAAAACSIGILGVDCQKGVDARCEE